MEAVIPVLADRTRSFVSIVMGLEFENSRPQGDRFLG